MKGHNGWVTAISARQETPIDDLVLNKILMFLSFIQPVSRQRHYDCERFAGQDSPRLAADEGGGVFRRSPTQLEGSFSLCPGQSTLLCFLDFSRITSAMQDVVVSSDGQFALSGSWDGTLRLWDLNNGSTTRRFVGHTKDVLSVAFSHDNRFVPIAAFRSVYRRLELARRHVSPFFALAGRSFPARATRASSCGTRSVSPLPALAPRCDPISARRCDSGFGRRHAAADAPKRASAQSSGIDHALTRRRRRRLQVHHRRRRGRPLGVGESLPPPRTRAPHNGHSCGPRSDATTPRSDATTPRLRSRCVLACLRARARRQVSCVRFSPSATSPLIVSCGWDKTVKVADTRAPPGPPESRAPRPAHRRFRLRRRRRDPDRAPGRGMLALGEPAPAGGLAA